MHWKRTREREPKKRTKDTGHPCKTAREMSRKHDPIRASNAKKAASHVDTRTTVQLAKSAKDSGKSQSETSVFRRPRKRVDSFSHAIYEAASKIFLHLKGDVPSSQLPVFDDDLERRRAYSMAFGAKRYELVLEDVLLDSYFFSSFFKMETYHKHRVYVMLFDYQQNGFFFGNEQKQKEVNEEDILPDIAEIQAALASHRTKLRAALARCRIRDCAISVEALLPMEEQEKIKYAAAQPVYARVNTLKSSLEDVMARLQKDGYVLEEKSPDSEDQLTGKNFISDEHFDNLLVFSAEAKFDLHGNDLTNEGCLVIQDKSTVISVEVVRSFVNEVSSQKEKANILIPGADMKKMLGDGDDIIQTHVESGNITAYLSSVIHPDRTVFTFGATPDTKGHLQNKMEKLGARNVTFLEEHFLDAIPNDERFRKVKIIVVNVPCSKTGIVNPVDFVLQEGVSASIKELARGGLDNSKIRGLAFQHLGVLKHAMSFPLLQGIVYITRSIHTWENIDVVKKAMEEIREAGGKLDSYYDLAPALPNLAKQLEAIGVRRKGEDISLTSQEPGHNYLKLEPSAAMNGGFVALLTRKKPVESPADVLERAAKKGLMKPKGGKTPRAQSPKSKRVPSAQSKRPPVPKQELEKLTITDTTEPVVSDTELDSAVKGKPASKKKTRPHGSADSVPVKTPSKTKAQKKAEKERAEKEHEEHMRQFKF